MRIITVLIVFLSVVGIMTGMSKIAQIDAMIGRMMTADQIQLSANGTTDRFTIHEYLTRFSIPLNPFPTLTFGHSLTKISSGARNPSI